MGRHRLLALAAGIVLACGRADPVGPPSGLPAFLTVTRYRPDPGTQPPAPTIDAAGDSIVATFVGGVTGCSDYRADAGWRSGALVVTLSEFGQVRVCLAVVESAVYRIAVHAVPGGSRAVRVERRYATGIDGKLGPPSVIARRMVSLP